jgi:hypothetical protein
VVPIVVSRPFLGETPNGIGHSRNHGVNAPLVHGGHLPLVAVAEAMTATAEVGHYRLMARKKPHANWRCPSGNIVEKILLEKAMLLHLLAGLEETHEATNFGISWTPPFSRLERTNCVTALCRTRLSRLQDPAC